jgi:hypothetical protein
VFYGFLPIKLEFTFKHGHLWNSSKHTTCTLLDNAWCHPCHTLACETVALMVRHSTKPDFKKHFSVIGVAAAVNSSQVICLAAAEAEQQQHAAAISSFISILQVAFKMRFVL